MPEGGSLPAIGSGVSLFDLAWHASFVVQVVMAGLLSCSVWVWAIAIDKIFLYSRTRRAMDRFEQAFWSGESIEELYRTLAAKPTQSMAAWFVGLFGTVWGIMTSFQSIAAQKNTSLSVVAPGIAEALFATAVGLIAAIPATIFYNKFTSEVNRQAQRLEGFADEFSAILSRQIDERA
jgi:biopolymer transport protein TolQ